MASGPARTADDLSDGIRSIVERVLETDVRRQIRRRGEELADMVTDATAAATDRAADAWKDSASTRREAAKNVARARRDAAKWSYRTWRRDLQPALRALWKRRVVALTAAGAAVPAGRELVDTAAARLGLRERREGRRWGAFFVGLLIGAAIGAVVALLSAPKPGRQMRDQLTERGREVAGDLANRARENDWMPLFQRPEVAEVPQPPALEPPVVAPSVAPEPKTAPRPRAARRRDVARQPDETGQAINESFNEAGEGEDR